MLFALFAMFTLCGVCFANPAFAADDPLTIVNNLSDFVFSLIRAVGVILLGWGVVQVGLSFQSHDPSQRSQGFLTLAGGLVVTFFQRDPRADRCIVNGKRNVRRRGR